MKKAIVMAALLVGTAGCGDRLGEMQNACRGTWQLESRQLANGTTLRDPAIRGVLNWEPIDARKAHVSLTVVREQEGKQLFDHALSTYEISTSAITRKRHVLIQRGYRDREGAPLSQYIRAKTEKGKASIKDGEISFRHAAIDAAGSSLPGDTGYSEVFKGDVMIANYADSFTDTWRRIK